MEQLVGGLTKACEKPRLTIAEDLQVQRDRKVKELEEIDAAIALFKKHPEVEQCLTQLAKCGIYR